MLIKLGLEILVSSEVLNGWHRLDAGIVTTKGGADESFRKER